MMKSIAKILSILLCAIFVWNSAGVCLAEGSESYSAEYALASSLGYFDGITQRPDDALSGSTFARIMYNVLGYNLSDVYPGMEPTEILKCMDAVKVFLDLAGYKGVIAETGGYPNGYAIWATNLGLTKGMRFSGGEPTTMRILSKLLYNSMDMSMFDEYYNKVSFGTTILHLEKITGTVTANSFCGIDRAGAGDGNICIDGVIYACVGGFNGDDLLGYPVDAYRIVDEDEIRFATPTRSSDTMTIEAEDIDGFADNTLTYYNEAGKKQKVTLSSAALVLKNNELLSSYSAADFDLEEGSVTLVNRNSNQYDLVIIRAYTDFVVSHLDTDKRLIYNKLDGAKLELDESKHTQICDLAGNELTLGDVSLFDVLSVADSQVSTEIIVSKEKLDGAVISEMSNEGGENYLTIGGKQYVVGDAYLQYSAGVLPKVGDAVTAYLNAFEKLVYLETTQQDMQYGYLLKTEVKGAFNDDVRFRILTTDNTFVTLTCTEKITISDGNGDEQRLDKTEGVERFLSYEGLVMYKVNEAGLLTTILCPYEKYQLSDPNRLYRTYIGSQELYRSWAGTLGGKAYLNDSTYIFSIPDKWTDEEQCSVLDRGDLPNGERYDYIAYSVGDNDILATCLVLSNYQSKVKNDSEYYAVTKIGTTVAKTGEVVQQITCENNKESIKYRAEFLGDGLTAFEQATGICGSTPVKIEKGDIIKCTVSKRTGFVETAYILFDANGVNPAYPQGHPGTFATVLGNAPQDENKGNPFMIDNGSYLSPEFTGYGVRYYYGWVYKKAGVFITVTNQDLSCEAFDRREDFFIENHAVNIFMNVQKCMTVSQNGRGEYTVKSGSQDDIISYQEGGDSCSRVIVITQSQGDPVQMIILND